MKLLCRDTQWLSLFSGGRLTNQDSVNRNKDNGIYIKTAEQPSTLLTF